MKLLDANALRAEKGITYSPVQLWRLVKAGKFPALVKVGEQRNYWVDSEIDAFIASRIDVRDTGASR